MIDLLTSGCVLLVLDQWSKNRVRQAAPDRPASYTHFFRIRCVTSVKRIYSCEKTRIVMTLVWVWALISALALRHFGQWFHERISLIGLGFALGGAAGNLLDIWRHHSVVDFIDFGWWPVFNFASSVTSLLIEDNAGAVTAAQPVATDDTTGGSFVSWVILAVAIKA